MKRIVVLLLVTLVVATLPTAAFGVDCVKKTTTYWGYNLSGGGTACNIVISPPIPPEVIGQKIRECDGYTWTWGNTTCTYYTPTIAYEDCPPCNQAQNDLPQNGTDACPAVETAE